MWIFQGYNLITVYVCSYVCIHCLVCVPFKSRQGHVNLILSVGTCTQICYQIVDSLSWLYEFKFADTQTRL